MRMLSLLFLIFTAAVAEQPTPRRITVFSADEIIPQIADGGSWKTSITLVNLDSKPAPFTLRFYGDNGLPLALPILNYGLAVSVSGTLPLGGSRVIETEGRSASLSQGWAELEGAPEVGGMAVFRQQVGDRPGAEAIVPISSRFDSRMVLPFDNTDGFVASFAVVNPSSYALAVVTVVVRAEDGSRIAIDQFDMQPRQHMAFRLMDRFPVTSGRRGTVEISTSALALSALGLRFSPAGVFTSFHALSGILW